MEVTNLKINRRIFLYPLINYIHTEICKIVLQNREEREETEEGRGPKPADKKDGDFPFFSYL